MSIISGIAKLLIKKDDAKEKILRDTVYLRRYLTLDEMLILLEISKDKIFVKTDTGGDELNREHYLMMSEGLFDYLVDFDILTVKLRKERHVFATFNNFGFKQITELVKTDFFRDWSVVHIDTKDPHDVFQVNLGPFRFYINDDGGTLSISEFKECPNFSISGFAKYYLKNDKDMFYNKFRSSTSI